MVVHHSYMNNPTQFVYCQQIINLMIHYMNHIYHQDWMHYEQADMFHQSWIGLISHNKKKSSIYLFFILFCQIVYIFLYLMELLVFFLIGFLFLGWFYEMKNFLFFSLLRQFFSNFVVFLSLYKNPVCALLNSIYYYYSSENTLHYMRRKNRFIFLFYISFNKIKNFNCVSIEYFRI